MSTVIYVLDTAHLDELFGVDGFSNEVACAEIRRRFKKAGAAHARFFVPLPCLFELGTHVAQVKHDERRKRLASELVATVKECLEKERPWTITPVGKPAEILSTLIKSFETLAGQQRIGLVDAFVAAEARRLKEKSSVGGSKVHIWTNDRALKSMEPDQENDPFHW